MQRFSWLSSMKRIKIYPLRFMHRSWRQQNFPSVYSSHPRCGYILNLQKLINISHQLEITPVQMTVSLKFFSCWTLLKNTLQAGPGDSCFLSTKWLNSGSHIFKCGSYLPAHLTFMMRTPGNLFPMLVERCRSRHNMRVRAPLIFIGLPGIIIPPASINIFSPEFVAN